MTTIEYLLDKMPLHLQKIKKEICNCGHHTIEKRIDYGLKIDLTWDYNQNNKRFTRYKIYYQGNYHNAGRDNIIGPNGGFGYLTQKGALKALLKYKEQIKRKDINE